MKRSDAHNLAPPPPPAPPTLLEGPWPHCLALWRQSQQLKLHHTSGHHHGPHVHLSFLQEGIIIVLPQPRGRRHCVWLNLRGGVRCPLPLPLPLLFDTGTILLDGVSNRNTYLHIHMYLHTINGRHVDIHTVRERIHMHTYKQVEIIHTHKLIRSLHTAHTYQCTCVCVCVCVCVCACACVCVCVHVCVCACVCVCVCMCVCVCGSFV